MKLVGFCALALVIGMSAAMADPMKIRTGWVSATSDTPLLLGKSAGITKHEGISYTLEAVHFQGSPQQLMAFAASELDFVGFGYSALPTAILNAGMGDLRIIGDVFQDGAPGSYSNEFLVLKDGPIHSVADLKGKVAATNGAGSAIDMALRVMLKKEGTEDKRDYSIIEVAFPNMPSVLKEHKADIIASTRAQTADPAVKAYARPLFTQRDAIGRSQMSQVIAHEAFLEKNRAIVLDYLEDMLRVLAWYSDPAHHDEVVKNYAEWTKVPAAGYDSWLFVKGEDFYRDPNGLPAVEALQANIETQRSLGLIKAPFDVKKYIDLSYIKEAAKRLN